MKKNLLRGRVMLFTVLFSLIVFAGIRITYGTVAEPGSEQDPVITLSYIQQVTIPKIHEYVDEKINEYKNIIEQIKSSQDQMESRISTVEHKNKTQFIVVSVKSGQKLIGDAGAEMILRMGLATIISTEKGGLADVTGGIDLVYGDEMPANHLLVVPLGDGRGFEAATDVLVMVKGLYEIKD